MVGCWWPEWRGRGWLHLGQRLCKGVSGTAAIAGAPWERQSVTVVEMSVGLRASRAARASSQHSGRSITELPWKWLQKFQFLEIWWRKQMCSLPHLGVWVINTVFPGNLSQKFKMVFMFFLTRNSKEPIKKKKKLSQMPTVCSFLKEPSTTKLSEMGCSFFSWIFFYCVWITKAIWFIM